jgi:hypothetical protein
MNTDAELPEDVVAAIEAGRKIEAIKLLREQWDLDLKSAKKTVEAYAAGRPGSPAPRVVSTDSGFLRFVLILIVVAILYFVYRYLSGG